MFLYALFLFSFDFMNYYYWRTSMWKSRTNDWKPVLIKCVMYFQFPIQRINLSRVNLRFPASFCFERYSTMQRESSPISDVIPMMKFRIDNARSKDRMTCVLWCVSSNQWHLVARSRNITHLNWRHTTMEEVDRREIKALANRIIPLLSIRSHIY